MSVEFALFGYIEAYDDGQPIAIGYAQLRSLLAVLLVQANRSVSVDQITDRVWGDRRLPRHPRRAVQHDLTLLRQALAGVQDVTIDRSSAGYQLSVDAETVDVHRFTTLLERARATGNDEHAAELFDRALRLRRAEACMGLDTPWANSLRDLLDEQFQAARLDLTDIKLRLGQHVTLVAELAEQAQRYPLDERIAAQYMLALYRSGRQAQALDYYQRVRHDLADQLGVSPAVPLQRLYQQVLGADPAVAAPAAGYVNGGGHVNRVGSAPVPRQLPSPPPLFAGRCHELDQLNRALLGDSELGGGASVAAIVGSGGIGKTWLALRWAYQHLDRFPDGQLHVNLRGFDPVGKPLLASAVVRGFLGVLGVGRAALPTEEHAQVGLYRSLVAGRKMLIVLDNARDTEQVAPLLPGGTTCTVLITSRHRLTGLVTGHGARTVALDTLSATEARDVLAHYIDGERLNTERAAVAELLDHCGGLPLALCIVAARASSHPDFPLAALAEELRDHTSRLDALDGGELITNMRAVLSWSNHALSADAATVFEQLGIAPGPDIGTAAVVSLTGLPGPRVRAVLHALETASLIHQHAPGRYRMHDLVRLYAAEQARDNSVDDTHNAALARLVDFYLHTAFSAQQLLQPLQPPIELGEPAPGCHPCPLADQPTALAWFATEFPNLHAVQRLAVDRGWPLAVWRLAWMMTTALYRQGRFAEALTAWQAGGAAAAQLDDPASWAGSHQLLGAILAELGRYDDALHHLNEAVHGADVSGLAYTHHTLGWLWSLRGDNQQALQHAARALRQYRSLGVPVGVTRELTVIGWYLAQSGQYEQARVRATDALAMAREYRLAEDEGFDLAVLGYVEHHVGAHRSAVDLLGQATVVLREVGNTYYEALVLDYLGRAQDALGDLESACAAWRQALSLYRAQLRTDDAERVEGQLAEAGCRADVPSSHG